MKPNWHSDWLRTGRLPDGRTAYEVHCNDNTGQVYACCDPIILERKQKGLEVPLPDDPPSADGFMTPWEILQNKG
jgi:hypothetical protein